MPSLPWRTDYACHLSHRLSEPPAKGEVRNGLPRLAHSHAQFLATQTSVDLLSWARRSQWEWTGRQTAGKADITSGLQLGRAQVLRGLRNFLNIDRSQHHTTDRLKKRGVEKGNGRHSILQGRERSVFNQTNISTVSRATLGDCWEAGRSRAHMGLSEHYDAILSWNWNWRGRQRKQREDNIREWTGHEWSIIQREAENREEWRKLAPQRSARPRDRWRWIVSQTFRLHQLFVDVLRQVSLYGRLKVIIFTQVSMAEK